MKHFKLGSVQEYSFSQSEYFRFFKKLAKQNTHQVKELSDLEKIALLGSGLLSSKYEGSLEKFLILGINLSKAMKYDFFAYFRYY
jgi:hypothetical protein